MEQGDSSEILIAVASMVALCFLGWKVSRKYWLFAPTGAMTGGAVVCWFGFGIDDPRTTLFWLLALTFGTGMFWQLFKVLIRYAQKHEGELEEIRDKLRYLQERE